MTDAELRDYQRRHPHLFPELGQQRPAPKGAGVPRSQTNGYVSEAAFQADAVEQLILRGWTVQESLKGSARGGAIWYGKGWPYLQIYLEDGRRRLWFAELKQPGNTPTDDQLACHARLRRSGFRVVVAYFLTDLLAVEAEERA